MYNNYQYPPHHHHPPPPPQQQHPYPPQHPPYGYNYYNQQQQYHQPPPYGHYPQRQPYNQPPPYIQPQHHHHQHHHQSQQPQQPYAQQIPENDLSIYIGDLAPDVTEPQLLSVFQSKFPSARGAKIIMDPQTNLPKGYGFIKFLSEAERDRALVEMQGHFINNKAIKVNNPTHKRLTSQLSTIPDLSSTDPTNTAIYVSQLDPYIDEGVLQTIFGAYGEISFIKMLNNKFSAFVNYVNRESAEAAFGLNNYAVGNTRLKVQWGKNLAPPPPKSPPNLQQPHMLPPPHYAVGYQQSPYDQDIENQQQAHHLQIQQDLSPQSQHYHHQQGQPPQQQAQQHLQFQQPKSNSIYNPYYSYFYKEKADITNAYDVNQDNKAYMSWYKDSLKSNYYSSKVWNINSSQHDGPDTDSLESQI